MGNDFTILVTELTITFSDGDAATHLVATSGNGSYLPLPIGGTPCAGFWQALVQGEIDLVA